jgi:hypothetical protein
MVSAPVPGLPCPACPLRMDLAEGSAVPSTRPPPATSPWGTPIEPLNDDVASAATRGQALGGLIARRCPASDAGDRRASPGVSPEDATRIGSWGGWSPLGRPPGCLRGQRVRITCATTSPRSSSPAAPREKWCRPGSATFQRRPHSTSWTPLAGRRGRHPRGHRRRTWAGTGGAGVWEVFPVCTPLEQVSASSRRQWAAPETGGPGRPIGPW